MREIIAFFVAPLAAPFIAICYLGNSGVPWSFWFSFAVLGSAVIAYLVTFMLGFPLYLFLRAQSITAFVVAPAFGLVAGVIVTVVLASSFMSSGILQFGALSGAAVGAVLWLIARPDLQVQSGEGGSNDGTTP